jgi:hypothetical protein
MGFLHVTFNWLLMLLKPWKNVSEHLELTAKFYVQLGDTLKTEIFLCSSFPTSLVEVCCYSSVQSGFH